MGLETAADLFQEIVCCPRCRGPLPEGGACGNCGAPCRLEGPVLNFLGDEAFRTPKKNDVAMANWLIANRTRVQEAAEELRAAHGARAEKSDLDTQKLAANDSVRARCTRV
jgi:hypothetical protein